MILREFAETCQLQSPLLEDPFWSLDSTLVTQGQIALFYARNRMKLSEAGDLLDRIQTGLIMSAVQGGALMASHDLLLHEPPSDPFFMNEFLDMIAP